MRTFILILLLCNGLGAVGGGALLIADPSGQAMQMPLSFLEHSPFSDFRIPGFILLVCNGLLSLLTAYWVWRRLAGHAWLAIVQGGILCGWLSIQLIMIRQFFPPLHVPFYLIGIGLIAGGWRLLRAAEPGGTARP